MIAEQREKNSDFGFDCDYCDLCGRLFHRRGGDGCL